MKKIAYLVFTAWISIVHAGSYEDFFIAIKRDDHRAVAEPLKRGFDPNTLDPKGTHGLFLAVKEPAPKVAEVLIAEPKTKVEWRSPQDESPLMLAALRGETELVKKLIARDADVNKPGWAPLHYAATRGHLEVMRILLEHHAFIDAESPNKTTPLMMAAHYGTPEAVKLLLDEGADPTVKNELGLSAIDFAQRVGRQEMADLISAAARSKQPNKGKW